ncbi:2-haloalkanoic acid dehalogenase [Thermococcus sp. P6]|uniref:HAD family hydrolase n=1 Tax=Thermococcus sp. P6 TaxID=122420 RepID=UPI000B59A66B|nr:HAD family hydrolase [Thermococcus sp. P6]ASJ11279.1 2-haloalkanoic acid dehalogenase [Thermococcus sp. P6]
MKLVSFDVWNTLLDINVMLRALGEELSGLMGRDVGEEIALARARIKDIRASGRGDPSRALEESQRILANLLGTEVESVRRAAARAVLKAGGEMVLPGARETLKAIRERDLRIVVTGNVMFWPGSYTRLLLERFGLMRYVDGAFFADEVLAYKPMPEMFRKPLDAFGVKPGEAVHVGDTYEEDFTGALKTGMWAVWINPRAKKVRRIHERGFEVPEVGSILEVLEVLGERG